ncbi:hypothetical protein [Capnocytophaga canimorsus]|uniref:hypothetical protein n=1 Tax=Capnocytophaga canimorsus TaxID=28188 RepID=UPI0028E74747|nr:hypothetical protein [Capnocytophaga canimorsus]MDT9499165.1 hypothetical protein [Capnocytophaga canimorsus]
MEELHKRLLQVFDNEKLDNATKIKEKFGFNHTTATNYLKKGRFPAGEHIAIIKQKLEYLNLNWLFIGEGEMSKNEVSATFTNEEKVKLLEAQVSLMQENKILLKENSELKIANLKLQTENTELKKVQSDNAAKQTA